MRNLATTPADFQDRVEGILAAEDLDFKVRNTLELVSDTLALASKVCDVSDAARNIRTSLDTH
jgi:hypothetical protein